MQNLPAAQAIFNGTPIRVAEADDGELLFVASDIAKALGYRDSNSLLRMLDTEEIKGYANLSTLGGNQELAVINESGMYHAVMKSRRPEAKSFRRWVTSDLLPTLRKHGEYTKSDMEQAQAQLAAAQAQLRDSKKKTSDLVNYLEEVVIDLKVAEKDARDAETTIQVLKAQVYEEVKDKGKWTEDDWLPLAYAQAQKDLAKARTAAKEYAKQLGIKPKDVAI
jgi:prophage antirepressor-like protein